MIMSSPEDHVKTFEKALKTVFISKRATFGSLLDLSQLLNDGVSTGRYSF